jgi:anhydro-N-acetylmuramic acid kinase
MMTVFGIIDNIKIINLSFNTIILTGGGRNNLFIFNKIKDKMKNLNIKLLKIDNYGLNGDMIESQMFGYLAVRSIKKLTLSNTNTTGVEKPLSGGKIFGRLKN